MSFSDNYSGIVGSVRPFFVSPSGVEIPIGAVKNTVMNSSNVILANLVAGNMKYVPSHVGFVVSDDGSVESVSPVPPSWEWGDIAGSNSGVSFVVTPLVTPVSVSPSESKATFTANSGSGQFIGEAFSGDIYYHRAVLMSKVGTTVSGNAVVQSLNDYIPFSVVDFGSGIEVPAGLTFGVHWDIVFGNNEQPEE